MIIGYQDANNYVAAELTFEPFGAFGKSYGRLVHVSGGVEVAEAEYHDSDSPYATSNYPAGASGAAHVLSYDSDAQVAKLRSSSPTAYSPSANCTIVAATDEVEIALPVSSLAGSKVGLGTGDSASSDVKFNDFELYRGINDDADECPTILDHCCHDEVPTALTVVISGTFTGSAFCSELPGTYVVPQTSTSPKGNHGQCGWYKEFAPVYPETTTKHVRVLYWADTGYLMVHAWSGSDYACFHSNNVPSAPYRCTDLSSTQAAFNSSASSCSTSDGVAEVSA